MSAVADIPAVDEVLAAIQRLTPAEQAAVVRQLHRLVGRPVVTTPDVCGGDTRIDGTRIPVWVLEGYRRLGLSELALLDSYPTLGPGDLRSAWAYADANRAEMDAAIADNEAEPSPDEFEQINGYTWVHRHRAGG